MYLARACELASRAIGGTSPNPPVGAVVVKHGRTIGEGFHRGSGEPHAEVEALRGVRDAQGATLYVSLEPCNHYGRTPPCSRTILEAGITRVVVAALDPNPKAEVAGIVELQKAGLRVDVSSGERALDIIEPFSVAVRGDRPYISLKMATSLDGYVSPERGSYWLTGAQAGQFVRELRIMHDAVMVGAGTVRVDDPALTVRPEHRRRKKFRRIVMCETTAVEPSSRVFAPVAGYERTLVIAPAASTDRFSALRDIAHLVPVGDQFAKRVDLSEALRELKRLGVASILCEGGPTLAGRLVQENLVDRIYWLLAPTFLANPRAAPALVFHDTGHALPSFTFDRIERLGDDVLLSGRIAHV